MSFVQPGSAGVITPLTLPCDGRLACVSTIYRATRHETHGSAEAHVCARGGTEGSRTPALVFGLADMAPSSPLIRAETTGKRFHFVSAVLP